MYRARRKKEAKSGERKRKKFSEVFGKVEVWSWELRSLVTLGFFTSFVGSSIGFFIPIETYENGGNLTEVILMGVVLTIPYLFGWMLGWLFDKKGSSMFAQALLIFGMLALSLAFFDGYLWRLFVLLAIGIVTELLLVGSDELVSFCTKPDHFGRTSGFVRSITSIGAMAGPIIGGIMIDEYGLSYAMLANG